MKILDSSPSDEKAAQRRRAEFCHDFCRLSFAKHVCIFLESLGRRLAVGIFFYILELIHLRACKFVIWVTKSMHTHKALA